MSEPQQKQGKVMKPCPFCGETDIDPNGWMRNDGVTGPECLKCGATAQSIGLWNSRDGKLQQYEDTLKEPTKYVWNNERQTWVPE